MDNSKCYFDKTPLSCSCLTVKNCEGCSFRKTKKEYNEGIRKAAEILRNKGLVKVVKYDAIKKRDIVTTTLTIKEVDPAVILAGKKESMDCLKLLLSEALKQYGYLSDIDKLTVDKVGG